MKYKKEQKLYKHTLSWMNYGDVWTKEFNVNYYLSPNWMKLVRFILKIFFFFIGKKRWRSFEKKFLNYWSENIYGFSSLNYLCFIKNTNLARNYVSLYTLIAEKIT